MMAQVLSEPGERRHGFAYITTFNHEFGRITGMATTKDSEILLCDYNKKQLISTDGNGNYLNHLPLDSNPYDIAVGNLAYITMPCERSIIQVDPDRLVVFNKVVSEYVPLCLSSVANYCMVGLVFGSQTYSWNIMEDRLNNIPNSSAINHVCTLPVVKCFNSGGSDLYFCVGGKNDVALGQNTYSAIDSTKFIKIETLKVPSDICSDDNGHIYVSGQKSNNIHRLTREGKVVDIPLMNLHGIVNLSQYASVRIILSFTSQSIMESLSWCLMLCKLRRRYQNSHYPTYHKRTTYLKIQCDDCDQ